jgi:hypothetical protein
MQVSGQLHAVANLYIVYKDGWAPESVEVKLHAFLTSAPDGGECISFTPRKNNRKSKK